MCHVAHSLSGPTSHGLVYWLALGLTLPVATHVRSEERRASRASPYLPLYVEIIRPDSFPLLARSKGSRPRLRV
jgi:hypothetical protein